MRVHLEVATKKMEGSGSEDEGELPSNLLQNEFITLTQYENVEEHGCEFRKERAEDMQSSIS